MGTDMQNFRVLPFAWLCQMSPNQDETAVHVAATPHGSITRYDANMKQILKKCLNYNFFSILHLTITRM